MKEFCNAIQSIRQNRLRSALAGFGIAWGIFILTIFLGIGAGFRDGVMSMFNAFAQKSIFVYGGKTSLPSANLSEKTLIVFDKNIVGKLRDRYGFVESCSVEMPASSFDLAWDGETVAANVKGVEADYFDIRMLDIKEGRRISHMDDINARNVAVIGEGVSKTLFGEYDPIGKLLDIGGVKFQVVGVLSSEDLFTIQERNSVYMPSSSFVDNFNSEGKVTSFCLSLKQDSNTTEFEKDLKGYLAHIYGFDPHDEQAVYINNIERQTDAFGSLFRGLEMLIWIIGLCLLLSGIVGVCNVMLIIVKERTNEIGIRKAVGATSRSVITMILTESIVITFIAGIVGILLGVLVIVLANNVVLPIVNTDIMNNLKINVPIIITAFIMLCLSGLAAGLVPALKASQISPADAIRYENRG